MAAAAPVAPVPPPVQAPVEQPAQELVLATVPAEQSVNGHGAVPPPAPETINGELPLQPHIEERTCLIEDKPDDGELVSKLDQIATRVQQLEQNMIESLQRHMDTLLQPNAGLQEILSRLQHVEQVVAAQDDEAVQALTQQVEQLTLKLEQLQTISDKVDLLFAKPQTEKKLEQLEADLHSLASKAQTIAAQMEHLSNDKTIQALSGKIEAGLQADKMLLARFESIEKKLAELQQNTLPPDRMIQTLLARTDLLERRVMEEFQQQANQLAQATASRIEHLEKSLVGKIETLSRHMEDLLSYHSDKVVQSSKDAAIEQNLQQLTEMVKEVLPPPKKQKGKDTKDQAQPVTVEAPKQTPEAEKPKEEKQAPKEKKEEKPKAAAPQEERRKEPRYRADDMSVALFRGGMLKKLIVGKKNIAFYIKDLSNNGMRVQPVEVLEVGEVLSGQVTHLRLTETVPIECRVVWFRETERGKFEAGVEFINLGAQRVEKLKQIVGYLAQSAALRK